MKKIRGYISGYQDALLILYAVRLGYIDVIDKRLSAEDRERIETGDIFCFIESSAGIRRWTDGRVWSPSKILDDFLVYHEVPKHLSKTAILKRKAMGRNKYSQQTQISSDKTALCKKTIKFSIDGLNYHIVSYFRPIFATYSLMDIPFFRSLKNAVEKHPEIKLTRFINDMPKTNTIEFLEKQYRILNPRNSMEKDSFEIKDVEKIALEALMLLFNRL